jgi:hypothetical protein
MNPKPRVPGLCKVRLPGRNRVTIAAGFVARDGIVLCADTQETYGQLRKINVGKIIARPESFVPNLPRIVFAGAGHGHFIDKLANEAWKRVASRNPSGDFTDVCDDIESSIKDTHEEFGRIFQQGAMPSAEIIYGVAASGRVGLFRAIGPIVNPVDRYASVGVGLYLADYIHDRLGLASPALADSGFYEILAIYLLQQAKDYIEGCGGESHVFTLKRNGKIDVVDPADVQLIAGHITQLDRNSSSVLMSTPDLNLNDDEMEDRIEMFLTLARNLRKEHREQREQIEKLRFKNPLYEFLHKRKGDQGGGQSN